MPHYRNVCEVIVPNDLCIGCGLCVGVCPPDVLEMRVNEFGEYVANEYRNGCLPKCDLCLRTCPFWNQTDDEYTLAQSIFASNEEINYRNETGYFLNCFAGYSLRENQRANGASGGLATWFLQRVLEEKLVDKVVSVTGSGDPQKLYSYAILETPEEIQAASRSCYYPVELGTLLRDIAVAEPAAYIVVGLPCFLKGIRLAMRKNRRLRERIKYTVGLTCGQAKSRFFVEYLTALKGGDPYNLNQVRFREKAPQRPATDYGHKLIWYDEENDRQCEDTIFWTEGIDRAWTHNYFQPNACNFCDDIFAETADVTFMDAWLPQFVPDHRGHSLVLNRQKEFQKIWDDARTREDIFLEKIDVESIIRSQAGVLHEKRDGLQYRLAQNQHKDYRIRKRFTAEPTGNLFDRRLWKLKYRASRLSRQLWAQNKDLHAFKNGLQKISLEITFLQFAKRVYKMLAQGRLKSAAKKRLRKFIG